MTGARLGGRQRNVVPGDLAGVVARPGQVVAQLFAANPAQVFELRAVAFRNWPVGLGARRLEPLPDESGGDPQFAGCSGLAADESDCCLDRGL